VKLNQNYSYVFTNELKVKLKLLPPVKLLLI